MARMTEAQCESAIAALRYNKGQVLGKQMTLDALRARGWAEGDEPKITPAGAVALIAAIPRVYIGAVDLLVTEMRSAWKRIAVLTSEQFDALHMAITFHAGVVFAPAPLLAELALAGWITTDLRPRVTDEGFAAVLAGMVNSFPVADRETGVTNLIAAWQNVQQEVRR